MEKQKKWYKSHKMPGEVSVNNLAFLYLYKKESISRRTPSYSFPIEGETIGEFSPLRPD